MSKVKQTNEELQVELLSEKIKHLESQMKRPKTSDEEYIERVAKYEASKEKRDEEKRQIENRILEIWSEHPKARRDELIVVVGMERRAKQFKESGDVFNFNRYSNEIKQKLREIDNDRMRG